MNRVSTMRNQGWNLILLVMFSCVSICSLIINLWRSQRLRGSRTLPPFPYTKYVCESFGTNKTNRAVKKNAKHNDLENVQTTRANIQFWVRTQTSREKASGKQKSLHTIFRHQRERAKQYECNRYQNRANCFDRKFFNTATNDVIGSSLQV